MCMSMLLRYLNHAVFLILLNKVKFQSEHSNIYIGTFPKSNSEGTRIKSETQSNISTFFYFFPVRMKLILYISMRNYRPNSGLYVHDPDMLPSLRYGIFIPKGATNLKFVLLGLSSHNALQLSLCGLDSACLVFF